MSWLDEVAAAVIAGEMHDLSAIGQATCNLISGCERVHDFDRAAEWCERLKGFCERFRIVPLFAVCRTQYAEILMWHGA